MLSYTAVASTGYTVNAVGSFMNGSYSLSSFAYTVNYRDTNDSTSAGGGLMTFSGVNQGQAYSGTGSWARQETGDESENASVTELGCYANGSFNLSDIVYGSSGARSSSSGDTVQSTWSGEYYGTATYTGSDASDSSFSEYANGSYSMGSYSMSSYALGGSSEGSGSWENKSIDSGESLDVTFTLDVHSTLHQTGVMSANAFSNVSYSFSEITEQSTTQIVDGGAVAWGGTGDIEIAGAGLSGTETITNDLWGSWDTADGISTLTLTVALPGSAVVLVRPDDTGLHAASPDQVPVASCGPSMTQIPAMQTSLNAARAGEVTADGTAAAGEADSRALAWVVAGGELEAEMMGGAGQGGGEPTQLENMVYTGQPVQVQLMQAQPGMQGVPAVPGGAPAIAGVPLPGGRVGLTEEQARTLYSHYLTEQTRNARFGAAAVTVDFQTWLRGRPSIVIVRPNGQVDPRFQPPPPPQTPAEQAGGESGGGGSGTRGVGQPGFLEGMVPFWGSGRAALDDFQNGRWGWGLLNTAFFITDLFLVKSLATGVARVVARRALLQGGRQTLGRAASSRILGRNLEAVGVRRGANTAAHHIVAGGDRRAAQARAILERAGVDINEAANGVFLPRNTRVATGTAIPHSRIHTNRYYQELTRRLQQTNDVRRELNRIRQEILNGTFPH